MFGFKLVRATSQPPADSTAPSAVLAQVADAAQAQPTASKPHVVAVAILKVLSWTFREVETHPEYLAMAAKIVAVTAPPGSPASTIAGIVSGGR
jgi:hypothetical protein